MSDGFCRQCLGRLDAEPAGGRCPSCGSTRLVFHAELFDLSLAHLDCDAFYASVEKRDDPALADRPVIVGGGHRGVVSACCYVARLYGVRSAMPMFKALEACPDAVVIRPNMEKYRTVARAVRQLMLEITPLVEPLSLDEAFMDLSGTEKVHAEPHAMVLARLARRIEDEIGITISVGLSYNKFLAKIASDLDKPRGFAVIGVGDAEAFLADRPVGLLWGVGKALQRRLAADGIVRIRDLRRISEDELVRRYGKIGHRLAAFAVGRDSRTVSPDAAPQSVSAETTFDVDIADLDTLRGELWPLCERVARRLRRSGYLAGGVSLKLKTARFRTLTRSRHLGHPTRLAELIYRTADSLLATAADGTRFRLIGVGAEDLTTPQETRQSDLLADAEEARLTKIEDIVEDLRTRLGPNVIGRGRGLRPDPKKPG